MVAWEGEAMSKPSKYDQLVRELLFDLGAEAAMVLVIGGRIGSGCARAEMPNGPEELHVRRRTMVHMLRLLADDIEKGITQPDQPKHRRGRA
jgi:hypothetical protein